LEKVLLGGVTVVNVNKNGNTIPFLGIAIPYTKDLVSENVFFPVRV
jgi:hypothetical protein